MFFHRFPLRKKTRRTSVFFLFARACPSLLIKLTNVHSPSTTISRRILLPLDILPSPSLDLNVTITSRATPFFQASHPRTVRPSHDRTLAVVASSGQRFVASSTLDSSLFLFASGIDVLNFLLSYSRFVQDFSPTSSSHPLSVASPSRSQTRVD
ncbi:hypothetical protein BDY24DRAFT_80794 [Mrakia frigida]|uniref:uncharacterized protein n=1 Tax=Mrakia frigida TaxID=29902 RepID=UPI003FCC1DBE